jgi:hypothetical protein
MGNPSIIIFGLAKVLRSIATIIEHNLGRNPDPRAVKGLRQLQALAHIFEVAALATALGIAGVGATVPKIAGEVAAIGVASSKGVRAGVAAYKDWRAEKQVDKGGEPIS